MQGPTLSVVDHDRAASGMTYVYPVVSRRAGGVSVGINLNPNNACNWRCVYCQVPELTRGNGPELRLDQLEHELRHLLQLILHGDFMQTRVPEGARVLRDLAFSGNGEPTGSPQFPEAVEVVRRVLAAEGLLGKLDCVLITNGSGLHKPRVQRTLVELESMRGQVWVKLDRATGAGTLRTNSVRVEPARQVERVIAASQRCKTWIQMCLFARAKVLGAPKLGPSAEELAALLRLLAELAQRKLRLHLLLEGVLLYGLARPSLQPEAPLLGALPAEFLEEFAARIEEVGLPVRVSA